jgi:DNA-binding transcriptional regulator YhcF (GntR family)
MKKWFLDKSNKIPLYLQLKDVIKYYVSTGEIQDNEKLPGVVNLSKELEINFETVRKAYKELEKEGLISTSRGKGSFATLRKQDASKPKEGLESLRQPGPEAELRSAIRGLLKAGRSEPDVISLVHRLVDEASNESTKSFLIVTECSELQVNEISKVLKDQLKIDVRPVLVEDLKKEIDSISDRGPQLLSIVTTGFHLNEVRKIVADKPIDIQVLIAHLSPQTRLRLASFSKDTRFGFICRDEQSILIHTDMLKTELGKDLQLSASVIANETRVDEIIGSVDVLLVTPAAYEAVKQRTSRKIPIYNVFDSIEPMSLKIIQSNISQKLGFSAA